MTTETTTTEATPATPSRVKKTVATKTATKTAKKATKKATPKKAPVKKASKPSANGEAKEKGVNKPQLRILQALAKINKRISKKELAEKSQVDPTKMGVFVGPRDNESAATSERWPFPGLVELGLVKVDQHEDERGHYCTITAKGKKLVG